MPLSTFVERCLAVTALGLVTFATPMAVARSGNVVALNSYNGAGGDRVDVLGP
jgi:hypothetical protein